MAEKLDAKKALQDRLVEIRAQEEKTLDKINAKQDEQKAIDRGAALRDYKNAINELKATLDSDGKQVLEKRAELEKKFKKYKKIQFAITMTYAILAVSVFAVLQLGFTTGAIIAYLISAVGAVLVYIFPTKSLTNACTESISATYSQSCILEYDKKEKELRAEFVKRTHDAQEYLKKLKDEEMTLWGEQHDLERKEKEIIEEINEFDFNYTYRDTILFWGCDRGNRYDIYLDGLHYDTVAGRRIAKIILTPGLHSFKVENTAYNIDNSIIYAYEFPTRQFTAGDGAPCHAIVCDFKTIREVSGTEFQKITKTRLI